jgi:hypothetical protein
LPRRLAPHSPSPLSYRHLNGPGSAAYCHGAIRLCPFPFFCGRQTTPRKRPGSRGTGGIFGGGRSRARTCDLSLVGAALSPLSYPPAHLADRADPGIPRVDLHPETLSHLAQRGAPGRRAAPCRAQQLHPTIRLQVSALLQQVFGVCVASPTHWHWVWRCPQCVPAVSLVGPVPRRPSTG